MPHPRRREHVCRITPRVDYSTAIIDIISHAWIYNRTSHVEKKKKKGYLSIWSHHITSRPSFHLMGLKFPPPSRLSLPTFSYEYIYPTEITSSSIIEFCEHVCFYPRSIYPTVFIHSFPVKTRQDMTLTGQIHQVLIDRSRPLSLSLTIPTLP